MYLQSWIYTKKFPKGRPVFFEDGRKVSDERGFELFRSGVFGEAGRLKEWFEKNVGRIKNEKAN